MEHSFDTDTAKIVGINAAVIYKNIKHWVIKNKANEKHLYEGRYWTYNSIKAFSEILYYLSEKQIILALKKLEDEGFIKTGVFNKNPYDRTKWYCDLDPDIANMANGSTLPKSQIGDTERCKSTLDQLGNCITNSKLPDVNTNNKPSCEETSSSEVLKTNNNIKKVQQELFPSPNKVKKTGKDIDYVGGDFYNKKIKLAHLHNQFKGLYLETFKEFNGISDTWNGKSGNIAYEIIKVIADKTMELKEVNQITNDEVIGAIDYFFYSLKIYRNPYFLNKFTLTNLYSNTIQVFVKIKNNQNGTAQQPAYQSQSQRISSALEFVNSL